MTKHRTFNLSHIFNLLRKHHANCLCKMLEHFSFSVFFMNMPHPTPFRTADFLMFFLSANMFLCYQSEGWTISHFNFYFVDTEKLHLFYVTLLLFRSFFLISPSKVLYSRFLHLIPIHCLINLFLGVLFHFICIYYVNEIFSLHFNLFCWYKWKILIIVLNFTFQICKIWFCSLVWMRNLALLKLF